MSNEEALQMALGANLNHERALAFGRPVLRAAHPDAILVGYSVTASNGSDVVVESNHVLRSSLSESQPVSFTIRTAKSWTDVDWLFHGADHVMNTDPTFQGHDPRATRDRIISVFTEKEPAPINVAIDDVQASGEVLQGEGIELVRVLYGTPTSMITIAAPHAIIEAGFISTSN